MMIPLRLIFGEKDRHEVFVDATDINIVAERTVAAFPVPISSYRAAIDTNIPQIIISVQGIIQDDPMSALTTSAPSSLAINFANILPTTTPAVNAQNNVTLANLNSSLITLLPAYWRYNSPNGGGLLSGGSSLRLQFTNTVSNRAGGSATPSVNASYNLAEKTGLVQIDVPVGGVLYNSANSNPASTLALIVQDALQLTTEITKTSSVNGVGGKQVNDAFNTSVSETTLTLVDTFINDRVRYSPAFSMTNSAGRPIPAAVQKISSDGLGGKVLSAGDKAQNLLGLLANSTKDKDLLRGIQIPYNSLITSNDITPVVRNFFLTAGKVSPLQKGSLRNTRPSTLPMDIGTFDSSGQEETGEPESSVIENLFGIAVPISGIGDVIGDAWAKVTARGATLNNGGISVIPESFHMSKEGAENYYRFDLQVVSADHVIGVN